MNSRARPAEAVAELLSAVVDCVDRSHLEARIRAGQRLRIKLGIDPSAPDLHLGHTVPMRLLRRWQEHGHLPVLIVGDFTARIGDPSGTSGTRPQLTEQEVEANARTYLDQLYSVVDRDAVEVHRQSEWYGTFGLDRVLTLTRTATVAQMLQRADFDQRLREQRPIGVHELLYPLLQGYDSVAIAADVELGGTDQLFNLLRGREVQAAYGMAGQDVVTVPLLLGLDGRRKMSKSLGNAIGLTEAAEEQFGKLMSLPDSQILPYLQLVTSTPAAELLRLEEGLTAGRLHPRELKELMARRVVAQFHGEPGAERAAGEFVRRFREGGLPSLVPEAQVPPGPLEPRQLLTLSGLAPSGRQALDWLRDGAVRLDQHRLAIDGGPVDYRDGSVLSVGSRRVVRLRVDPSGGSGASSGDC